MLRKLTPVTLALIVASNSGCSFMFMNKAPQPVPTPNYPVECTSSSAAPILDSICTGYFIVNTVTLAGLADCSNASYGEKCIDGRDGGMVLSAGLGALCLAGAVTGFGKAAQCQAVKNQNALCITGNGDACRALNPAWRPSLPSSSPAYAPVRPPAPAAAAVPAAVPPAAAPPAPEQRADGLPAGSGCTATWQCAIGLACEAGLCAAPPAPGEGP